MGPILMFLLTLLRSISASRYVSFSTLHGLRVSNVYEKFTIIQRSKIACSNICATDLQCKSVNFNNKTMSCELSAYHPDDLTSRLTEEDGWMLIYKKDGMKDSWTVVFRGSQKIGIDVVDSFFGSNTNSLPTPDPECYFWNNSKCNTHVRSSLIDNWINLNIREVKVEFLTNGQIVAYIIFQNRATDNETTWFSPENLLNSTWADLPLTDANYALFLLDRGGFRDGRRSFTIYKTATGCTTSEGWMFVSEVTGDLVCTQYEYHDPRPVFLYSKELTAQVWSSGPDVADVMLVSIKA